MNKKFTDEFYKHINNNTLIGIKAGRLRKKFLDIWMVEVEGRIFARSWNKSKRSWFTEFIHSGEGQIKYGEKIIPVKGQKLEYESGLSILINKAYLEKYNQPENLVYSIGITQTEYEEYTMEFFFVEN